VPPKKKEKIVILIIVSNSHIKINYKLKQSSLVPTSSFPYRKELVRSSFESMCSKDFLCSKHFMSTTSPSLKESCKDHVTIILFFQVGKLGLETLSDLPMLHSQDRDELEFHEQVYKILDLGSLFLGSGVQLVVIITLEHTASPVG
jgi:hypothetical protein